MRTLFLIILTFFITLNSAFSATLKEDKAQVTSWNTFASELYQLHLNLTQPHPILTTEETGGYGGGLANKNFYREVSYFNKDTKKIISKIQWEIKNPDSIHAIEVYLYNKSGQVKTDFYARYLPYSRHAPIQTLINLHNYSDKLHSFRQFDANGELIYESCSGKFFDKEINLYLDDDNITEFRNSSADEFLHEAYTACFMNVAATAGQYLHPAIFIENSKTAKNTALPIEHDIAQLSQNILTSPKNPQLLLQRGKLYFDLHEFDKAINDFNAALSIDASLYQVYFDRGMVLSRNGKIDEGIKDLTVFIKHHPENSQAFTKRGVRYIWAGKLEPAQKDLQTAIKLDNSNSEAHDDLGVIYAQQKNFAAALKHFSLAIQYDPTYQKAHHNQALVYNLTGEPLKALAAVNTSLALASDSRNSLILKSAILNSLGKTKEAEEIDKRAEFLPEGNWSERFEIK
jgi:tetratricopeptide (TPR) repeat protein